MTNRRFIPADSAQGAIDAATDAVKAGGLVCASCSAPLVEQQLKCACCDEVGLFPVLCTQVSDRTPKYYGFGFCPRCEPGPEIPPAVLDALRCQEGEAN